MTDYAKKTNAELAELLKARGLAHTGKKAELVARLQESDAAATTTPTTADADAAAATSTTETAAPATATEDVIDWDDDADIAVKPTSEASAAALAAGGIGAVANPTAVPNQVVDTEPEKTDDLTVATGAEDTTATATETAAPEPVVEKKDYSQGLGMTSREEEIAKRKARAAKFGIEYDDTADKRAAKFGTGEAASGAGVKGLDEALPERGPRKRGREDVEAGAGRGGKRMRGRGGRGVGGGRRGGPEQRGGRQQAAAASSATTAKTFDSEKDRLAAEARKQRFATAN